MELYPSNDNRAEIGPRWRRPVLLIGVLLLCFAFLGQIPGALVQSQASTADARVRPVAPVADDSELAAQENTLFLPLVAAYEALETSHFGRYWDYEGSSTCNECHLAEAQSMLGSVHYQWQGDTPQVENMERGGKLGGINDFCGYPDINFIGQMTNLDGETVDGGCATCHTGLGDKPDGAESAAQLANIDCLVCHADNYRRKVEPVEETFRFVPAPERMTVDELFAISDVHMPTDDSCINCHAYAGGGENNKRGDIEAAHRDPPSSSFDVHMASAELGGAGLGCLDCHTASDHRIAGRGSDLRPTDMDVAVRCTNCHVEQPHAEPAVNAHTARVDCATCHIPSFARIQSTDMVRDFRAADIDEHKRLYEPRITRQANVIPDYRFFNGNSTFYEYDLPVVRGENGRVSMSAPLGDVNDGVAKIIPFKEHMAFQPYDLSTNKLIPVKMGVLFQTGDVDTAIRQGASAVGWPLESGYDFVETERALGIFHEVAPAADALGCNDCHNGGSRLDFAALGYTPRTEREGKPLCESCHEDKSGEWNQAEFFDKVHEKHVGEYSAPEGVASVEDESFDCIECHTFSAAR